MAAEIRIPPLGESINEATLVRNDHAEFPKLAEASLI